MSAVVVSYSATPEGEAALTQGITEARRTTSTLVVVDGTPADAGSRRATLHGALAGSGLRYQVRRPAADQLPAEQVALAVQCAGASLVVVGMQALAPVAEPLLSPAAQQVLLDVPCPVLTVRASYQPA